MAAEKKADAVKSTVTIKLAKAPKGEPDYVIASLNGKNWRIQRNTPVEIPRALAQAIRDAERAQDEADKFVSTHSEK